MKTLSGAAGTGSAPRCDGVTVAIPTAASGIAYLQNCLYTENELITYRNPFSVIEVGHREERERAKALKDETLYLRRAKEVWNLRILRWYGRNMKKVCG